MHRYSHYIYWHINKQNRLLCCKPPEIFPEGLIPPVVTSGQARRLRRYCLVPCAACASSFPRVQASKLPCTDCSASAMWPCCIWSLLHVEPLHICDLPTATFKLPKAALLFSPSVLCLVSSAPQIKSSTFVAAHARRRRPFAPLYLSPVTQAMACIGEISFFSGRWADVELEEARLG